MKEVIKLKLPFKTKLFYGIGGTCDNALYMLAGTYLLLFLMLCVRPTGLFNEQAIRDV